MQHIQFLISKTILSLYNLSFTPEISPAPKPELGEYCVNIFPIVKQIGKAPNIISEEVARELQKNTEIFASTSATGGYVNFFLTDSVWLELFSVIASGMEGSAAIQVSEKQSTGLLPSSQGQEQKTIVVDYIGANAGKPLHIGHICTPSIGQVICNIYEYLGYKVIGDSHFGDWGGIFGKLIFLYKINEFEKNSKNLDSPDNDIYGKIIEIIKNDTPPENIKNIRLERKKQGEEDKKRGYVLAGNFIIEMYFNYIEATYLCEKYENIDSMCRLEFKKLSEGDSYNINIWRLITERSVEAMSLNLNLLNVHATYNIGESFYEGLPLPRPNNEDYPELQYKMKDIVTELIEKGVATQNEDGSVGVNFPEEAKMPSCILQKKDGTGLYLTSDLAAIKYRLTNGWNPTKIIYSVDVRQQLHLKQAFWIAQKAWPELTEGVEFFHAFNGFIKLKEGAMSTRHGTVIFLQALIDEGNSRTREILKEKRKDGEKPLNPEDIQAITVGAIKYSYLAQDREKDVTFDWDKALNFEGNSGPYIQYAYVRAKKIIAGVEPSFVFGNIDSNNTVGISSYDKSLIQSLARFNEIIDTTAKTYKPHHLALYCYDLAVIFNSFYVHTPKILEETNRELRNFRLSLCKRFTTQIHLGFELLGIKMPSEM